MKHEFVGVLKDRGSKGVKALDALQRASQSPVSFLSAKELAFP